MTGDILMVKKTRRYDGQRCGGEACEWYNWEYDHCIAFDAGLERKKNPPRCEQCLNTPGETNY